MFITRVDAEDRSAKNSAVPALVTRLRRHVEDCAVPRDCWANPVANRWVRERIADHLSDFGYCVTIQGPYSNVLALPDHLTAPIPIVCAHYDSVACTPGADDNASGIAVLLEIAQAAASADTPIGFVGFNAEEHGLAGSRNFVTEYVPTARFAVQVAHILEMVGFTTTAKGSQKTPSRFRSGVPDVGDFVGIAANHRSAGQLKSVLRSARALNNAPSVVALRTYFGAERWIPDLYRSDHAPFWHHGIPALVWTDTAEFRNPNYHRASDTPDTLDYDFMVSVAALLAHTLGVETWRADAHAC